MAVGTLAVMCTSYVVLVAARIRWIRKRRAGGPKQGGTRLSTLWLYGCVTCMLFGIIMDFLLGMQFLHVARARADSPAEADRVSKWLWLVAGLHYGAESSTITVNIFGMMRSKQRADFAPVQVCYDRVKQRLIRAWAIIAVAHLCVLVLGMAGILKSEAQMVQINTLLTAPLLLVPVYVFLAYQWPMRHYAKMLKPEHERIVLASLLQARFTSFGCAGACLVACLAAAFARRSTTVLSAMIIVPQVILLVVTNVIARHHLRRSLRGIRTGTASATQAKNKVRVMAAPSSPAGDAPTPLDD